MQEAHYNGMAVVIVCGQADAEEHCMQLRGNGLLSSIEPASGGCWSIMSFFIGTCLFHILPYKKLPLRTNSIDPISWHSFRKWYQGNLAFDGSLIQYLSDVVCFVQIPITRTIREYFVPNWITILLDMLNLYYNKIYKIMLRCMQGNGLWSITYATCRWFIHNLVF